ncbi:MAG: ribosome maturation factor RimM [Gammaproteobacteria bacterium]|nr:ribosome maturation factor RimM [Gammaproteobacteria bacterium]
MASIKTDEPVLMGEIVGLFGVRGWVKVYSYARPREAILGYDPWLLEIDGNWRSIRVKEGRAGAKGITVQLEGFVDRDQAQSLVGSRIAILPDQLPPLVEGEYYWSQLTGLKVVTLDGVDLGIVDHLIETGANDVLVVESPEKSRMLPYIPDVVKRVDLTQGVMEVDWDPDF